jgi:hypothetical protein
MKSRRSPIIRAVAVVGLMVAGAVVAFGGQKIVSTDSAYATQGTGITSNIVARGGLGPNVLFGAPRTAVVKRTVRMKARGRVFRKTVRIKVPSIRKAITCPCDTAFQQLTIQPGGSTGWHTHPGVTFVAVAQGELTYNHVMGTTCPTAKMTPGAGFFQMPTEVHVGRNVGSVPVVVYTLYLLPPGTPNTAIRVDQPQPTACPDIH